MTSSKIQIVKSFVASISAVSSDASLRSRFIFSAGHFSRHRKFDFYTTTACILSLLKRSLHVELFNFCLCLQQQPALFISKSGFCQQRQKINSLWFEWLLQWFATLYDQLNDNIKRWHGYRLMAIDGSTFFIVKDQGLLKYYEGSCNALAERPLARVLKQFDILNQQIVRAKFGPYKLSERKVCYDWTHHMKPDCIYIMDRGFPSYTLFFLMNMVAEQPIPFVVRCKHQFSNSVKAFAVSNQQHAYIQFYPDHRAVRELKRHQVKVIEDKNPVSVRAVKVMLGTGDTEILLTNLDERFSAEHLKELYGLRWGIETSFNQDKTVFQTELFSSHKQNGIEQDFYASMILQNIHALITTDANEALQAQQCNKTNKYIYKVNVSASLYSFKKYLPLLFIISNIECQLIYLQNLFCKFKEPVRPNRSFPRNKYSRKRYGKHETQKNYRNNL